MTQEGSPSSGAGGGLEVRAAASLIGLLLLGLVDNQILSPVLREIASSFQVSIGGVGATVTGYALAAAAAALIIGPLSDRFGRHSFLLGAGLAFAAASVMALLSPVFSIFAMARVVAGAAAGVISALVVATIADRVPYERRGRAMSWVASAYFAAPIVFVPAASWLADRYSWRSLYVVFTLGAVVLTLAFRTWAKKATTVESEETHRAEKVRAGYLAFFRKKSTAAGAFSAFFVSGGITVFILYLGAYLGERFGLSVTGIGLVFLLSGAASLAGALGAGPLADRLGKRPLAIGGSLALVVLVLAVPYFEDRIILYTTLGLTGLAAASRVAPLQSLVTELVSRDDRGAYVALRNTLSQGGIAVAASVGAVLYARGGYSYICYLSAVLSLLAAASLALIEEPVVAEASTKIGDNG
jgi:predicted MFS family arabinose efflux permease